MSGRHAFNLGDGLVVIGRSRDRLHILNATGRFIWERYARGMGTDTISGQLARRFDVPPSRTCRDVTATIAEWRKAGLLGNAGVAFNNHAPAGPKSSTGHFALPPLDGFQQGYHFFDRPFLIQTETPGLLSRLHSLFAHLPKQSGPPSGTIFSALQDGNTHSLYKDAESVGRYDDEDTLLLHLHHQVALMGIENRECLAVLHAGAVSDGERAIVMPASGGSGKSTLTAALAANHLIYLGDDIIPIERGTGHAVPMPGCLNLKAGSVDALKNDYPSLERAVGIPRRDTTVHLTPPANFEQFTPRQTFPVAHLVFPRYQPGAATTLKPISPLQALERMLQANSLIDTPIDPDKVAELASWLDRLPAWTLILDDLGEACETIQGLFES